MSSHEDPIPADSDAPSPTPSRSQNELYLAYQAHEREMNLGVEKIAYDPSLDDAAKIDAVAEARGWFRADATDIDAYLSSQLTLTEVVNRFAIPIEELYQSPWQEEKDGGHQRTPCSPEEASDSEMRGPEGLESPEPENPDTSKYSNASPEGDLWDLWYSVLHASKKIPWDDAAAQNKLVELVEAFKARPDPPPPAGMTVEQKENWVWDPEYGPLWSGLLMLGAASREVQNDTCGVGSGFTPIEQRACMNINAFSARLTVSGIVDYDNYGSWSLRDALEDLSQFGMEHGVSDAERRSCFVKIAAVWILVAGKYQYPRRVVEEGGGKGDEIDLESEGSDERFPWHQTGEWTDSRWTYWRRMFGKMSREGIYTQESRGLAARAEREIAALQEVKPDMIELFH